MSPDINYNKIKYKSDIFALGDFLMIRDVNDGFLIGKLIKVVQTGGFKKYPYWPTIQVQWCEIYIFKNLFLISLGTTKNLTSIEKKMVFRMM